MPRKRTKEEQTIIGAFATAIVFLFAWPFMLIAWLFGEKK